MLGESENVPSAGQIGGIIPHFHYDVIGRILPGVFFLLGFAFLIVPTCHLENLKTALSPPKTDQSGAYLIFLVALSLFFLLAAGYVTGSFLGSLSYFPFEKWKWLRTRIYLRDLNAATVFEAFRAQPRQSEQALRAAFMNHFGEDINQESSTSLQEQSKVCIYYVWARKASLGQMSARWDAESLASRNILFASCVLFIIQCGQMIWHWFCYWYWHVSWHWSWDISFVVTMLLIFVSALSMYEYERRRQIIGRFSLFWALAAKAPSAATNTALIP